MKLVLDFSEVIMPVGMSDNFHSVGNNSFQLGSQICQLVLLIC